MVSPGETWGYTVQPAEPQAGLSAMVTITRAGRLFAELYGATEEEPAMLGFAPGPTDVGWEVPVADVQQALASAVDQLERATPPG